MFKAQMSLSVSLQTLSSTNDIFRIFYNHSVIFRLFQITQVIVHFELYVADIHICISHGQFVI